MRPKQPRAWLPGLCAASLLLTPQLAQATAAELYDPLWGTGGLAWTNNNLFNRPPQSSAYLENMYTPWWQGRTAHPVSDYTASLLPAGAVRLDGSLEADYTVHRTLRGWTSQASPSNIDELYNFTPGSTNQQDRTGRSGQYGFLDFGVHPFSAWSADIGAEFEGNYDQRYWFPVSDEHRMFDNNEHAKIVRGEVKYDDGNFMMRGFEGAPVYGWLSQNDLFGLLPSLMDNEYYRLIEGSITPRGGEMRWKTAAGTLDVIGGTEMRLGYGSSIFAKYDFPTFRNLEQTIVYRNENIPFGLQDTDERRWSVSYNASYPWTDRITSHAGVMYQPFRLNTPYQNPGDTDANGLPTEHTTDRWQALGFTARTEVKPASVIDLAGLGYTYLGPVAGDKQEVDLDAGRAFGPWTLSGAYSYRQPVIGPVPLLYEGTPTNPGAILASPRGPDDPFWVQWDNRKAHIFSLTLVFNPDPGTPLFKYQRDILDDWNLNPDQQAMWVGAVQYRLTDYLTNTDRLYSWDENRTLQWDPVFSSGALASAYPMSSFSALARYKPNAWRYTFDCSAGESLAGLGVAYEASAIAAKPTTIFVSAGAAATNGALNFSFRYGQDVWAPLDYQIQNGLTYHKIYEASMSYNFLRDLQAGIRYTGTRMTDDIMFIGTNTDTGAFNEYTLYMTYHFSLQHNFGSSIAAIGRPIEQALPESSVSVSNGAFTPDGSGPTREIVITPQGSAPAGVLSWKVVIHNATGETVHQWEGSGAPSAHLIWNGLDDGGKPLPVGTYRITLNIVDLYGNEVTSPAQPVEVQSNAPPPAALPPPPPSNEKSYSVTTTAEGLKVTLSSFILFDVNQTHLKDSSRSTLNQLYQLLKAYPTNTLRIEGYTDSSGSASHNQTLSVQRAQSVADALIAHGIAPSRITVVGYGARRPIASNKTEEGRQQNRRVEIEILK